MRICRCLVNHQPAAVSLLRLGHIRPPYGTHTPGTYKAPPQACDMSASSTRFTATLQHASCIETDSPHSCTSGDKTLMYYIKAWWPELWLWCVPRKRVSLLSCWCFDQKKVAHCTDLVGCSKPLLRSLICQKIPNS